MSGRKEIWRENPCNPLEAGQQGEGLVVCYKAWKEAGGLDLEERRERWRSGVSLPVSLVGTAYAFSGSAWSWGLSKTISGGFIPIFFKYGSCNTNYCNSFFTFWGIKTRDFMCQRGSLPVRYIATL